MIRLLALICLLFASPARADELRPGYLELTEGKGHVWAYRWKAPLRGGLAARGTPDFPEDCKPVAMQKTLIENALLINARLHCAKPLAGRSISINGLDQTVNDVLVRIHPLGRPVQIAHATPKQPSVEILERAGAWQVARSYFRLGLEHILGGIDHLLFVACLVLLLTVGWRIVQAVTAFTIAHSITLGGAALGYLGLPQRPVECVIALSILFLAVEIAKRDPARPRFTERFPWIVAFIFGLLHGFGFAGALAEIGLPEGEVPVALLTFNLGVEAGQIGVVLLLLALLALLRRVAAIHLERAVKFASYAIGIVSTNWLFERLIV
jgi:hydrogenase/urease accessory protein HupE